MDCGEARARSTCALSGTSSVLLVPAMSSRHGSFSKRCWATRTMSGSFQRNSVLLVNTLATFRKPSPISLSSARHITWIERCQVRRATVEPSMTWSSAIPTLQKKDGRSAVRLTVWPQAQHRSSPPAAASSGRQRGSAQASPALSTLPLQSDGQSHGSVRHQQTSTEELRAPGAWSSSLLASGPPLDSQGNGPESASRGTSHPSEIIPEWWATSSRNGGRNYLGMAGDIIPESWAASPGIGSLTLQKGRGRVRRYLAAPHLASQ